MNDPQDTGAWSSSVKQQRTEGLRHQLPAADAEWIRAAVDSYEVRLTQYAARLLGDADRARDVVQDTFVKLWTADRAQVDGHLSQWLFRVCRNRALDVSRKEVRMKPLSDGQMQIMPAPPSRNSHEETSCESATVLAAIDSLPDRQQEVIRLKFQAGLSYKEIAAVMDLTANHVGVLIHMGIKAIREKLNPVNGAIPQPQEFAPVDEGRSR